MSKNVFSASLHLWSECNFNCSFCIGARKDINNKDWKNVNQHLEKVKQFFFNTGTWEIALIGGEPTINPYLPEFCEKLFNDGHTVTGMTTNASIPLNRLFSVEIMKKFQNLTFSYHPQHENNSKLEGTFFNNIHYALSNNVNVTVAYVLLPERIMNADNMVKRFTEAGAQVQISPLYGTYKGKSYPANYKQQEISFINDINQNICLRQKLEYGSRISTLQECSAGYRSFEIFLQTGKVDACPHQQSFEIFNYLKQSSQNFLRSIHQKPQKCLEHNCVCGFTYAQRAFLQKYRADNFEPDVYEAWKKLCNASPEVKKYWEEEERKFVANLKQRIKGTKVFIWGAGVHTSKLYDLNIKNGFPVELIYGIIDSNPKKANKLFYNKKVISADAFFESEFLQCSDIIISSANFENEIYEQILKRIPNSNINIIRLYDGSFGSKIPI